MFPWWLTQLFTKVVNVPSYVVCTCGFYSQDILKLRKVRDISTKTWSAIIVLFNEWKSERVIASQLKLSKTCVHQTMIQYKETDSNREGRELPLLVKTILLLLLVNEINTCIINCTKKTIEVCQVVRRVAVRRRPLRVKVSKQEETDAMGLYSSWLDGQRFLKSSLDWCIEVWNISFKKNTYKLSARRWFRYGLEWFLRDPFRR